MTDFAPRHAVITGGASGIGLALGKRLAASGALVMVADLPGETLDRADRTEGLIAHACDVSDLPQLAAHPALPGIVEHQINRFEHF
ncbi:MAG: SDR family NAD(P)-dependent oxidoreductase, partial [Pseudomonadota bacterium]